MKFQSTRYIFLFAVAIAAAPFLLASTSAFSAFASPTAYSSPPPTRVIVTGAAGRTGCLVFSLLQNNPSFHPIGLVRTEKSAKKFIKRTNASLEQVVVQDVTLLAEGDDVSHSALANVEAMVICTSAMPVIMKRSIVKILCLKLLGRKAGMPQFRWRPGHHPEKVDFEGQVAQINLAKKIKADHVVLVSSMGGTQPDNFLNTIGKKPDGTGHGDILLWKRKAEKYLIDSGLSCTIIHPGGLKDNPPGQKTLVLDVDDTLLDSKERSISRADVAELCVSALSNCRGKHVVFDCVGRDMKKGNMATIKNADAALLDFLKKGKKYDYLK